MKKLVVFVLVIALAMGLCACGQEPATENIQENYQEGEQENVSNLQEEVNTPEEVAAAYVESEFEYDFDTLVETLCVFRLRWRALSYVNENEVELDDRKAIAQAMKEKDGEKGRPVEILKVSLVDRGVFTDASLFETLTNRYSSEVVLKEEFNKIAEYATVLVDYTIDNNGIITALDYEVGCVKMDNRWYVLSLDGKY